MAFAAHSRHLDSRHREAKASAFGCSKSFDRAQPILGSSCAEARPDATAQAQAFHVNPEPVVGFSAYVLHRSPTLCVMKAAKMQETYPRQLISRLSKLFVANASADSEMQAFLRSDGALAMCGADSA